MSGHFCRCQCKMCRFPGGKHCHAPPSCAAPQRVRRPSPAPVDERQVIGVLQRLAAGTGSHAPSVWQLEQALPGLVQVDACFLANPHATAEVMKRIAEIQPAQLESMVSHYPSQAPEIAAMLAPSIGVPAECLLMGNGACEVIHALLTSTAGPVLISVPTFSAYYEFAAGPVITHQLDHRDSFRLDLQALEAAVTRHHPSTVVIINPNNPDGGLIPHADLVAFVQRMQGRVETVIVDESFSHFTTETDPASLAALVPQMPHLVVVNSLSKSHGIAGLRLGYAVISAQRVRVLNRRHLWNLNCFAQWFVALLGDPGFQVAYELARKRYVRDTRALFAGLGKLSQVNVFPSAANFALLQLDRPAHQVAGALLARHGIYVRDCADKRGLDNTHFIRVAARTHHENDRVVDGLRAVLVN